MTSHVDARSVVRSLSQAQCRVLIDHVAHGTVPVEIGGAWHHTTKSLTAHGLVRPATDSARPRATVLTERGRMVAAALLAQYAEALVLVGHLKAEAVELSSVA